MAGAFIAILLLLASSSASAVEGTASALGEQAEGIEAELARMPGDEELLASLTRTRINAANAMVIEGAGETKSGVDELKQELDLGGSAWSKYLKVAKKPDVGLAVLVAPALFQAAELSTSSQEALEHVKAAVTAQTIVVDGRPGKSSWSTLAFYELFAQRYNAADEAIEKAIGYANTKFERESLKKTFKEAETYAKRFGKRLKAR